MRFLRYDDEGLPRFGRLEAGMVTPLDDAPWAGGEDAGRPRPFETVTLLPPVPPGGTILCIGRNYFAHAKELGNEVPAEPLVFLKPATSLLPHGGTVLLPPESERVDFEGELALVIGRRARRVGPEAYGDVVFGATPALDITARDLQKKDGQWWRAKGGKPSRLPIRPLSPRPCCRASRRATSSSSCPRVRSAACAESSSRASRPARW